MGCASMAQAALDSEGYNRGMTTHGAMVIIDAESLALVCPYHGPQAGAEYGAGQAPCGCAFHFDKHGQLRALRGVEKVMQHADSLRLTCNLPGSE